MRVKTEIRWNARTHDFVWMASDEFVVLNCSGGDPTAKALEKSQAAMSDQLNQDYTTTFGEQQDVLSGLQAKLNYVAANPMGYTPQQLATARTSINENTAAAAKQAIGSAAAFAASHGGADVGNGAVGQIAGQIGSAASQSKAQQLAGLSEQNQQMKQQNFWSAIQGLNSVGSQYGGGSGTAIGGSGNVGNSSVNAGELNQTVANAAWQNVAGVIGGIGGLVTGGANIAKNI